MLDSKIQVKLENFDGPLSLLLHLLQKKEMKLRELSINEITNQYLDYLKKMRDLNFDIAGDYLLMAATLLFIKSQDSLVEGDDSDLLDSLTKNEPHMLTKSELIKRLEELQRFQKLGTKLWELPKKGHDIFVRPKVNRRALANSILTPVDLELLTGSMIDILKRENKKYYVQKREKVSIKEKLITLKDHLIVGEETTLKELFAKTRREGDSIFDLVVTFISLLELARLKKVDVYQNEDRGDVYVTPLENLNDFDVNNARGFDDDEENENVSAEELQNEQLENMNDF